MAFFPLSSLPILRRLMSSVSISAEPLSVLSSESGRRDRSWMGEFLLALHASSSSRFFTSWFFLAWVLANNFC